MTRPVARRTLRYRKRPVVIEAVQYVGGGNLADGPPPTWLWEALEDGRARARPLRPRAAAARPPTRRRRHVWRGTRDGLRRRVAARAGVPRPDRPRRRVGQRPALRPLADQHSRTANGGRIVSSRPTCTVEVNRSTTHFSEWHPCGREAEWFVRYPGGWFPRCEQHHRRDSHLAAVGINPNAIEYATTAIDQPRPDGADDE